MGRREFIAALGGAAAWPLAAHAQQSGGLAPNRRAHVRLRERFRRERGSLLRQGLQELGWADGRNVRIDTRWTGGDADRFRKYAAELVGLGRNEARGLWPRIRRTCAQRLALHLNTTY
jgi:putative tryptophan/tyrosine transport system substrate-binding protein